MVQAVLEGEPMRRVAVRFSLSMNAIQNIVIRDIPLLSPLFLLAILQIS